jgi:hypothetical protein
VPWGPPRADAAGNHWNAIRPGDIASGESITGSYDTTIIWDLSDDGHYYTDAWLYTGTNDPAVPHC